MTMFTAPLIGPRSEDIPHLITPSSASGRRSKRSSAQRREQGVSIGGLMGQRHRSPNLMNAGVPTTSRMALTPISSWGLYDPPGGGAVV